MKKLLFLGLGIFTALSALVVSSQAGVPSRYWRYTYQHKNDCNVCLQNFVDSKERFDRVGCCDQGRERPFSDRIGPFKNRIPTRTELLHQNLDFSHPSRRPDVWYYAQYRKSTIPARINLAINRAQHPELYPRNENLLGTKRVVVRNGDYTEVSTVVYEPDTVSVYRSPLEAGIQEDEIVHISRRPETQYLGKDYTLEVPAGFVLRANGHYENIYNSVSFRLVKTPDTYSCVQQSFEECAIDLGKGFKDDQQLVQMSQLKRDVRWDQTLGAEMVRYPTLTESFHANGFGSDNVYLVFNALDPHDGSVIRLEAVANQKDTDEASRIMQKVFQSFRFQL
ncbi:hypothetical protein K9L27_02355 [Candidatus Gracilibacteria bacterium]|nr:hypothetical protein [Candidatus Gracilibacteria bacterium]